MMSSANEPRTLLGWDLTHLARAPLARSDSNWSDNPVCLSSTSFQREGIRKSIEKPNFGHQYTITVISIVDELRRLFQLSRAPSNWRPSARLWLATPCGQEPALVLRSGPPSHHRVN